jgi:hypothetical protein
MHATFNVNNFFTIDAVFDVLVTIKVTDNRLPAGPEFEFSHEVNLTDYNEIALTVQFEDHRYVINQLNAKYK